jgi:DNA-binding response OmpR family regulator
MKKIIVVAEENEILNYMLEYYLKKEGYEVKMFMNGKDVLVFMQNNKVDLLIADPEMPLMEGMEIIQSYSRSGKLHLLMSRLSLYRSDGKQK